MAKRKRTEEEQQVFDAIDEAKAKRRELLEAKAMALLAIENIDLNADSTVILVRTRNYLASIMLLRDCEGVIASREAEYKRLRTNGAQS
jgi:hypothetical protein